MYELSSTQELVEKHNMYFTSSKQELVEKNNLRQKSEELIIINVHVKTIPTGGTDIVVSIEFFP